MALSPCRTPTNCNLRTQKCVPCREYAKPNRSVLSALQMYLNQKRRPQPKQAKHLNCWGQLSQKISNPSKSDDWEQHCHHDQQI